MVYVSGASGVNPHNESRKNTEQKHDSKFERNVDFHNTPNPSEVIGRSVVKKNKNKYDYTPLNDKDYKKLLAKVNNQLEQFPDIREKIKSVNLNQARVQLLNRILNNENLLANDFIYENVDALLLNYKDNMIPLADRVYSNEKLHYDEILDDIMCSKYPKQQSDAKCKLLDKIIEDEPLYGKLTPNWIKFFVDYAYSPDDVDAQVYFIKSVHENPDLSDKNSALAYNYKNISKNNVNAKVDFINSISKNKQLTGAGLSFVLNDFVRAVDNDYQYAVAKKFFSDEELYSNFNIFNSAINLIQNSESEPQSRIAIKFLENKSLHQNEKNSEIAANFVEKSGEDFMRGLIATKLIENKDLIENKEVIALLQNAFAEQDGLGLLEDERNAKNEFLYNIISSPEIVKDKELLQIVKKLHLVLCDPSDAGVLASPKVLNYIKNATDSNEYKVYTDMENSTYNIKTVRNGKKFIQKFKVEGDDIEVVETRISRGTDKNKKELKDGSYIVSKKTPSGSYYKTVYDSDGVQQYSEVIKKDRLGQFSIIGYERGLDKSMRPTELATTTASGNRNENRVIDRNFVTEDGSHVQYKLLKNPKDSELVYNISDSDNESLVSINRTFKKIDSNTTTTTINGVTYDAKFSKNSPEMVTVTKTDKDGNVKTIVLDRKQLDPNLFSLYKKLPGDAFFALKKHNIKVYMNGIADENNARFCPLLKPEQLRYCTKKEINENVVYGNSISIYQDLKHDAFTFMHELGHALNYNNNNFSQYDMDLRNIISDELSEYRKNSSPEEEEAIDYFIDPAFGNKSVECCVSEFIAENYALSSGIASSDNDLINERSIILQKHFPKTTAYILNKLYNEK